MLSFATYRRCPSSVFRPSPCRAFTSLLVFVTLATLCSACHATVFVSTTGDNNADGHTWATAKATVQAGINAAISGEEVWVAEGLYTENITVPAGISLYGGFAGGEEALSQRDWRTSQTILDGNKIGSVMTTSGEGVRVDGFTIQHGQTYPSYPGGGVYAVGSLTLANNTITDNVATSYSRGGGNGGGVFCRGTLTLVNNTIADNIGDLGGGVSCSGTVTLVGNAIRDNFGSEGGGVYVDGSATLVNNILTGNHCSYFGGGLYCRGSLQASRNVISDNSTNARGGGIDYEGFLFEDGHMEGTATLSSNVVTGNSAGWGGGIHIGPGRATLINNTVAANTAGRGAGIAGDKGELAITNTVIAFNSSGLLNDAYNPAQITISHSDVYGNADYNYSGLADATGTNGNISADPLFVDRTAGNYRLAGGSPAINAGDDSVVMPGELDADSNPRILGAHVDMGAFEAVHVNSSLLADGVRALRLAAGLDAATSDDLTRLDVVSSSTINIQDAARLFRRAIGLDPAP